MEELLSLPNDIKELELKLMGYNYKKLALKKLLNSTEIKLMAKISSEKDDKGKAIFSNDTLRRAELDNRLRKDTQYDVIKEELKEVEVKEAEEKIEHTYLRRRFSSIKKVIEYLATIE